MGSEGQRSSWQPGVTTLQVGQTHRPSKRPLGKLGSARGVGGWRGGGGGASGGPERESCGRRPLWRSPVIVFNSENPGNTQRRVAIVTGAGLQLLCTRVTPLKEFK